MNVLKTEMRRGICSWKFAGSVVLILLMQEIVFLWQSRICKWMGRWPD